MALWMDLIDPATLTGYARASLADYEARKGTLARWLPNRTVNDVVVRFVAGQAGLVETAKFRAYDAEPEIGKQAAGKRVTLELPAISQNIPVSEYQQLRTRNASDDAMLLSLQRTTDQVVRAVADRIEHLRGVVLNTGKATISQERFNTEDDFARPTGNTVTAQNLWDTGTVSRLSDLRKWVDVYRDVTGEEPGAIVASSRVITAIGAGSEFQTQLLNGGARPSTDADVNAIISGAGLPPLFRFDRRVNLEGTLTRVLPDNKLLILPAPVDPNDAEGTDLGGTFWGQTLTSMDPAWAIQDTDQPGLVAGVYRNEKPPMIAEVISDAIALPVLTNASLSMSATVL
jgi:hypothetical protein